MAMDERIIRILQRLIAKEDSLREIGTEAALNEAEVAAAKIVELATKYQVELSEIGAEEEVLDEPVDQEVYVYEAWEKWIPKKRCGWEVTLANGIAHALGCRLLLGYGRIIFVGRSADRAIAMALFRVVRREMIDADLAEYNRRAKLGLNNRGFLSGFAMAAAERITSRLHAARQAAAGSSQALVKVDSKVNDYMSQFTGTTRIQGPRGINFAAFEAGREFGNRVDLSTTGVSAGGRRKALS